MAEPGQLFERKVFYAGQTIFTEGQEGHEAYVVQSGLVELSKTLPTGDKLVLAHISERALFGEMALIDERPRSAAATAVRDTVCILIKEREFKQKLKEMNPWGQALVRILVNNLRETNSRLEQSQPLF